MFLNHCKCKIKNYDVWHLHDAKGKSHRRIYLFQCPQCKKIMVVFEHRNKKSSKYYQKTFLSSDAINMLIKSEKDVLFKDSQFKLPTTTKPFGWVFGENKSVYDKEGNLIGTKSFECDFFGNKQEV